MSRPSAGKPPSPEQPSGPNPLFFGVLFALLAGAIAGASAGSVQAILGSNLIFRVAVGGFAAFVLYACVVALWLSWHRRPFRKLGVAGTSVETGASDEVEQRDIEVAEFMGTTTKAIEELERRVLDLEP